ncbi:MAG: hypothetical protein ACE5HB_05615, partial [Terriglobia bacterium]
MDGVTYTLEPLTGQWVTGQRITPLGIVAVEAAMRGQLNLQDAVLELDSLDNRPVYRITGSSSDDAG